MLTNIITFLIIVAIIAGACVKLTLDKKNGIRCSGCPYGKIGNPGCNCPDQPTGRSGRYGNKW